VRDYAAQDQHKRWIRVRPDRPGRIREREEADQAMRGHFAKHNLPPVRFVAQVVSKSMLREKRRGVIKPGDRILVDIFENERFVDVIETSKGHGFQAW